MDYKAYGYYSEDGREFIITERKTPRHFYNYFFNDDFISFSSQVGFGEGMVQDRSGNRVCLVSDRTVYIRNRKNGSWHLATGLPMTEPFDFFECHHGRGYSRIVCEKNGVRSEFTVFVPAVGLCERWMVKLTNITNEKQELSVIGYAATDSDEKYTPQGYSKGQAKKDGASNAVYIKNSCKMASPKGHIAYDYMLTDAEVLSFDTRRSAFIGTYGSKEYPEALTFGNGCIGSDCVTEKCCFALQTEMILNAGESKTVSFEIGHTEKLGELAVIKSGFSTDAVMSSLNDRALLGEAQLSGIKISTPDTMLNNAFPFYQYANNMGSRWARVRHNGFRDIVQDSECLAAYSPELAWQRIKCILAYQNSNGLCPRTFIGGRIEQKNSADNGVYLASACYEVISELGTPELLDEEVPFNDGKTATVFEHLRRNYEYLWNFQGLHGLIRIWGGDWHDGMNSAGLKGDGVSIMLSTAFVLNNDIFVKLAKLVGNDDAALHHAEMSLDMRRKIEKFGFCGEYYCTAINDAGEIIGAPESRGSKIFINPQTWAVMAGLKERDELISVIDKADEYLTSPYGTKCNYPTYTEYDPLIGGMTVQPAGTLINGAVYLQPLVWRLIADCILKRPQKVRQTLDKLLPWDHTYGVTYGEPYILYNFYHDTETGYRAGTPGQSWRTATHSVFIKALLKYIFGLHSAPEGLYLEPCIPSGWNECSVTKRFRRCEYRIFYHRTAGRSGIFADGVPTGSLLPYLPDKVLQIDCYL